MQALAIPAYMIGTALGGPIAGALAAAGTVAATGMLAGGGDRLAPPTPQIQRDDASAVLATNDAIAARKGGAADILNGDAGITQQMPGPKMVLGA